ncbi:protease complex subunit PrcB family protein [Archangium violaceum]|uniref:protease complex subunit PrcB family protein n=1 Tax=Archangium violaceum TaxID=83451 RepID=UPI001950416D|nr:protease complex subunit PrcB family protein [Archangium violaceum]QRN97151.1 protease complex subunit PrcB family protein [Archangium violaceum]
MRDRIGVMAATPVLGLLLSCAAGSASPGGSSLQVSRALSVEPLMCSSCTGDIARMERAREVIEDAATFRKAFLDSAHEGTEVPEVDFSRFVVVAVWMGQQSNCGSEISITGARETGSQVEVDVRTTLSGNCPSADAISYPFCFVRVERVAKPYVFQEKTETRVCE